MTTVLTIALDTEGQSRFEALRQQYYPAALNRIPAHLTLFHVLPAGEEAGATLREVAQATAPFSLRVTGVRSLGRGVAYQLAAPQVLRLHEALSWRFVDSLTPQDRQRFSPHIVVQNKVKADQARELLATLQKSFIPWQVQATGLLWWEYLGGPWRLLEAMNFIA